MQFTTMSVGPYSSCSFSMVNCDNAIVWRTLSSIRGEPSASCSCSFCSSSSSCSSSSLGGRPSTQHHAPPVLHAHDTVTPSPGSPATAVLVAKATKPPAGSPSFGDTYVIDDPLTEGPSAASPVVGRAQGFYIVASLSTNIVLHLSADFVFTSGKHNGSSVVVLARDAILDAVRELPVLGGTGMFRGATGYGLLKTQTINITTKNAVLQIDMYLTVKP
ncbi:Dirigent protein 19 [Dichanthelium oligosanthes]|uniref:Dirigent protein n=1 Tax=Dichanthelium oligosanthes TaxID=888268 RepID=A0A1E5UWI6_9POAL|nr:Dirigent protein 19 [Dichanthelium oligosanthes]